MASIDPTPVFLSTVHLKLLSAIIGRTLNPDLLNRLFSVSVELVDDATLPPLSASIVSIELKQAQLLPPLLQMPVTRGPNIL